jgi:hypothetical protein
MMSPRDNGKLRFCRYRAECSGIAALLYVKVKPTQLVTPPSPLVAPEAVIGMAVYSAKAMLVGKGHDVSEMIVENIP